MDRIPVAGPWITQKEIDYVAEAAAKAWYSNAGVYHDKFEKAFAEYVGRNFAVSLPHCTSAIHLSLVALGVGRGDEVIVPDTTWIASAAPVTYVGAVPVFADIDEATWCMRPDSFEACITPRTKAAIPVDLYGSMPDYAAIIEIANARGIAVIEDAAEAHGSEYDGRKAGSFGTASVFSFHGSKTMTTGEGGMLTTDDERLFKRVLQLRDHGRLPGDRMFLSSEVAFKYKMSSMQAALGLAQLERIEELVGKKRRIFGWYRERLGGAEGITLNSEPPGTKNSYWMVTAIIAREFGLRKESVMRLLSERAIDSRPFFSPLSSLPAYGESVEARRARDRNRVAYSLGPRGVNLPSALKLTEGDVDRVCGVLLEIIRDSSPKGKPRTEG